MQILDERDKKEIKDELGNSTNSLIKPLPIMEETYVESADKLTLTVNVDELEANMVYKANYEPHNTVMVKYVFECADGTRKTVSAAENAHNIVRVSRNDTQGFISVVFDNYYHKVTYGDKSTANVVLVETFRNQKYLDINNSTEFIPTSDHQPTTKKYVDDECRKLSDDKVSNPDTAEVGQILEVEAVDENGKPTKVKAVNKPTGNVTSVNGKTGKVVLTASEVGALPDTTKLSELTNDAGFITNTVSNLVNYYKKTEVYSRDEIDAKGFLTEHQSLEGLATEDYVKEMISTVEQTDMQVVESVEEMTNTNRNYVLKSTGEIWSCQKIAKKSYTNQIPLSVDADGNIYNSVGYKNGYRYNSSYIEKENAGSFITGFIPVKPGDTIYFSDGIFSGIDGGLNTAFCSSFTSVSLGYTPHSFTTGYEGLSVYEPYDYDVSTKTMHSLTVPKNYNISYVKFTFVGSGENAIITVNEPIEEITVSKFSPTGRYYGNESLQIVSSVDEMTNPRSKYVLKDTQTIWAYLKSYISGVVNQYNPDAALLNYRYKSSGQLVAYDGVLTTDLIKVDGLSSPYIVNISGVTLTGDNNYSYYTTVTYFDDSKTKFTQSIWNIGRESSFLSFEDGNYSIDISESVSSDVSVADAKYFCVGIWLGKEAITADDVADLFIEFVPKNTDATFIEEWIDTEIPYNGTVDSETLAEMQADIAVLQNENTALKERVDILETNGFPSDNTDTIIPDYWKTAVDALEDTIKEKFNEGGVDAFAFLWAADIHGVNGYTKKIGYVGQYATEKYDIPFVIFSGDIMSQASHASESNVLTEYANLRTVLSPIDKEKLLMTKGNHDGAYGTAVDGVYYLYNIGGKKVYNNLFRRQALDRQRVFGDDGSYYYVDYNDVRVIMLNGHTDGDGSTDENGYAVYNSMKNGVYGTEQLTWLANVALDVPEGTRIIVSAHQPFASSKDGTLLSGILESYNKRTTYSNNVDVSGDYWGNGVEGTTYTNISVDVDFTNAKGKIVIYLHGHIHKDTIDNSTYSFVVASITTAGGDVRDTDPVERIPSTATETAMDIVILNTDKINFIRLGAGESRVVTLPG